MEKSFIEGCSRTQRKDRKNLLKVVRDHVSAGQLQVAKQDCLAVRMVSGSK